MGRNDELPMVSLMKMSRHEFKYPKVTPVTKPAGTGKPAGEPPKR